MAGIVSGTYGHALFALALEKKITNELLEEATVVRQVMKDNPELMKLYNHPKISMEEKRAFTETCFRGNVSDDMTGFLILVVQNGRQNEIASILDEFEAEVKEYRGIGIAYVTTPMPMPEEQKARLVKKLKATTRYESFEMHYAIDRSLIGGMVVRIGDRVMDSSIRTQLEGMQKELQQLQV